MKNDLQLAISQVQLEVSGYTKLKVPEKITTNKDHKLASDAVKYLNDKLKFAEDIRSKYTKPLLEEKRNIDNNFKRLTQPLEILMTEVKSKMMDYAKLKQLEQAEYEKKMMENNIDKDLVIVDDKFAKIKQGKVSSNYIKTTVKYRVADPKLRDAVIIKAEALKAFMEAGGVLPPWIETYEEESLIVSSK